MRRFVTILLLVAVAGVVGGYFWLQRQHRQEVDTIQRNALAVVEQAQVQAQEAPREWAIETVRVLAITISDDVARSEYAGLQSKLATIARGPRIRTLMVLDTNGQVVAASDKRLIGQALTPMFAKQALATPAVTVTSEPPGPGQLELLAPLSVGGQRVGVLRAIVQVDGAPAPAPK